MSTQEIQQWLLEQLGPSQDIVFQEVKTINNAAKIIYINSLCDEKKLQQTLLKPFYEMDEKEFDVYLESLANKKEEQQQEVILSHLMRGSVGLFVNSKIYLIELQQVFINNISESTVETVIQGPQNALTESIATNINLIRYRYPQPTLIAKETKIGRLSETKVTIMYDRNIAKKELIEDIEKDLAKVDVDTLQAAGQLHKKLSKKKRTLFPTMMITERPDRIAYNLAQGKVVILIDGTPFSLIAPAVFYDFMSSMEDVYQSFWISKFTVTLRYIGLFISLLLPAFYVGVTAFNPEFFRVQLALSIAGSRLGVPYPAFLEVFMMLLMMELLTEASVRLPKSIGSTATTVGGLILGQAAVEAGLVSNVMIIIVAAVAISNFVIPINAMMFAMRYVKYLILTLTIFFGMIGLIVGIIGLIGYLTNLRSYGQPYLKLFLIPDSSKKEVG
ncbi:spore germination protein [Bacillus luteolus]|uniref:Spore germination protein n=1 Tax=Litchfieldia luteola TaxID=682179 RepID=A0ABR9QLP4_9BACI|nr:spore germination protein [Cytobacillus luteolus]MBE4909119.1 spore germination protein [Cytobacillus luteolus]MBP1940430.1 spore germination protein [Cytobacillus luteolus]